MTAKPSFVPAVAAVVLFGGLALAAAPPPRIHYQGILRGSNDAPLDGTYDMRFRFFNAPFLGSEILVDEHLGGGTGAVTVSGGLFGVALGGGNVLDGSGPGVYTSLTALFQNHGEVWLELVINGEALAPRVRVLSAAYALNAAELGGLDADSFLRSDTSDSYTSGTLTLEAPTVLDVNGEIRLDGTLFMNPDGPEGVQSIFFFAFGEPAARSLSWDNVASQFVFDDSLRSTGVVTAGGELRTNATNVSINSDGPDGDQSLSFFSGAPGGEALSWDDAQSRFEFSDDLAVGGSLRVGSAVQTVIAYNSIGSGTPDSGDISNTNDLYVTSDLEVDSQLFLNGEIRMDDDGPEADQRIYFYDDASPTGAHFGWDESAGGFEMTESLVVNGTLITSLLSTNNISSGGLLGVTSDGLISHSTSSGMRYLIDNDNNTTTEVYEWFANFTNPSFWKVAELQQDGDLRIGGVLSQNVAFDLAESFLMGEAVEAGDLVAVDPTRSNAVRLTSGARDARVLGVVSSRPGVLLGGAPFSVEALAQVWGADFAARFVAEAEAIRQDLLTADPGFAGEAGAIARERAAGADREPAAAEELQEREQRLAGRLEEAAIERFFFRNVAPVALAGRVPVKVDGTFGDIAPGDALAPSPLPGVAMKATATGPTVGIALEDFSGGRGTVQMFVQRGNAVVSQEERPATAGRSSPVVDPARGASSGSPRDGESSLRLDEKGLDGIRGSSRLSALDGVELWPVTEPVGPGEVLAIDPDTPGALRRARGAADPMVVGIVFTEPDDEESRLRPALKPRIPESQAAIALTGTVICKVDAGYGAISPGDLLTSSPTPGHAMRADDPRLGTVVGKALEPHGSGAGSIRVLVMLR